MHITPKLSDEEVNKLFIPPGNFLSKLLKNKIVTPKSMELLFLPFYLYDAKIETKEGIREMSISVDAILGIPAFFMAKNYQTEIETEFESLPFTLNHEVTKKIASDYCRGYLLEHGLKLKKQAILSELDFKEKIYFPFWIGYFQKKGCYDFKAIDAVSGELQGVQMRKLFLKAFRELKPRAEMG